jgi:UDP-N-acetylmuramoyl-L-alanyl-D-glutamate--2,6-diaminopimelate ligase
LIVIRLGDLLLHAGLDARIADRMIAGLTADSRAAKPGYAFFAVPGTKSDGLSFAAAAVANGARVVVAERPSAEDFGVPLVVVPNVRRTLSQAAAAFHPAQPETIVAVTGTSGKTSVAAFTRQIWAALGYRAAALGTTGVVKPDGATYGSLTTPDPVTLHRLLDELAHEQVTHLAMEASSHGLDQYRLDGVRLAAGAFTNLSRDHLDYHPDLESYFRAKLRLFRELLPHGAPAVVDVDSDYGQQAAQVARDAGLHLLTTGEAGTGIRLMSHEPAPGATRIRLSHEGVGYDVLLPLSGRFMVANALVAAGLCIGTGSAPAQVFKALEHLQGAPGRLERIGERHGAPVFVDYAHKPDALEKVLAALRPLATGRLIVVFGCGGDRDPGKRPIMGAIAVQGADVVIVTDDNPRSEEPGKIRAAILTAAPGAIEIGDRAEAIRTAVAMLQAGDVLVVAGKGHETGQIVGDRVLPFSDHDEVRAALGDPA